MRTVFVIFVAVMLVAAAPVWAFEPDWGEVVDINTNNCGFITSNPAWSPDGTILAFSTSVNGIWIVDVDGGSPTLVYCNYFTADVHAYPCFTPDGTEVTFTIYINVSPSLEHIVQEGPKIVSVNVTTGEYREITTGKFPVWSPSGRYLCHVNPNGDALVVYDTVTETETTLATIPMEEGSFLRHSFLPDESAVVFSTSYSFESGEQNDKSCLYRIPVTGGEPEEIEVRDTEGNQYSCVFPVVHPDGIHLVVRGKIGRSPMRLLWVNMNTGTVTPLTPEEEGYSAWYSALSPDGMRVCFVYRDPSMESGDPSEIHIFDLDESLFDDAITAVESDIPAAFPTLTSYPNPFNPSTTISFTLPDGGFTELTVYNLAGQKIRTLVAGELSAGVHEVVWDGCDDAGNKLSSGIFVSRLVTGDTVVTNRMTLVK